MVSAVIGLFILIASSTFVGICMMILKMNATDTNDSLVAVLVEILRGLDSVLREGKRLYPLGECKLKAAHITRHLEDTCTMVENDSRVFEDLTKDDDVKEGFYELCRNRRRFTDLVVYDFLEELLCGDWMVT